MADFEAQFAAIRDKHQAAVVLAERYRDALATLYVNAKRDPAATSEHVVPICFAVLNGATIHEAIALLPVKEADRGPE